MPETIGEWIAPLLSASFIGGAIGSLITIFVRWKLEEGRIKREERRSFLEERIDSFYSPLLFHFDHMKSWGAFLGNPEGYAFDPTTLTGKLRDMESIMRSGIRFASKDVRNLWHEWQPIAVAAVEERREGRRTYPQYDPQKFLKCSVALHSALNNDYNKLEKYFEEIGQKPP